MKFKIETHCYAPELNTVVFANGATIPAPGITSIREARERLFKPVKPGLAAIVSVKHSDPAHVSCDRRYSGRIRSIHDLTAFKCTASLRHNLADAVFSIRLKVIG